jgi:hypothetical protein
MNSITRNRRIILLAVIALAAAFPLGNSRPGSAEAHSKGTLATQAFFSAQVLGVVGGQKVRSCVGTLSPRGPALDWNVSVLDERGVLLFQSPSIHSPSAEWRCFDVHRSSIPLAGEPGTGRVQVAVRHIVTAPAGTQPSQINGSLELVNSDGTTEGAVAGVLYAAFHNNDLY